MESQTNVILGSQNEAIKTGTPKPITETIYPSTIRNNQFKNYNSAPIVSNN